MKWFWLLVYSADLQKTVRVVRLGPSHMGSLAVFLIYMKTKRLLFNTDVYKNFSRVRADYSFQS